MHWRRKWQPTPVFLPGESQGRGSLVGCHLWGHTGSDTTEATWQQQQPGGNLQGINLLGRPSGWPPPTCLPVLPGRDVCPKVHWVLLVVLTLERKGSWWLSGKEATCRCRTAGDTGAISGSRRFPGVGNGNPLQYFFLENPMDRGAWWAPVHGSQRVRRN